MIFLVGFMASGKTTIGLKLSRKLNVDFCDLDSSFEHLTKSTISAYFDEFGESRFRDKESCILCDAVNGCSEKVFATGGGVVIRPENRDLLQDQLVIYLKVPFDSIEKRLTTRNKKGRPLAKNNTMQSIRGLYEERQNWFEEVATVIVECENLSPDEIVDQILKAISGLSL